MLNALDYPQKPVVRLLTKLLFPVYCAYIVSQWHVLQLEQQRSSNLGSLLLCSHLQPHLQCCSQHNVF